MMVLQNIALGTWNLLIQTSEFPKMQTCDGHLYLVSKKVSKMLGNLTTAFQKFASEIL